MCLPIGSCFGAPRTDDDHYHVPANKHVGAPPHVPAPGRTQHNGGGHYNYGNGGGHYNYNGNGYSTHAKATAGAEADRKAFNDARRDHAGAAPRAWNGHAPATAGAQEKAAAYPYAGADETLKLKQQQAAAAWTGKAAAAADGHGARGGAAPHNYYYSSYERERVQPAAAHREDAAPDSHYTAATATADHERY